MNHIKQVDESLNGLFRAFEWGDAVRVVTHCLYPGNSFVQVVIRGGVNTFLVSDEGNAFRELSAAGVEVQKPDALVRHLIAECGLSIRDGVISSPMVTEESLAISVALVANASRDVARWLFSHAKIKKERDFKAVVQQFLKVRFDDQVKHETVVGASNKVHKFDNLIALPGGRRIIVDPVVHDANSINARLVANLDVRSAGYSDLEQRIVYDDDSEWKPDELNLLQIGATVVPFSKAPQVFSRLAGNA